MHRILHNEMGFHEFEGVDPCIHVPPHLSCPCVGTYHGKLNTRGDLWR